VQVIAVTDLPVFITSDLLFGLLKVVESFTILRYESKKQDTKLLAITSSDFQKFFTGGLGSKFATNSCLNIPPRFKHVATLPCEI